MNKVLIIGGGVIGLSIARELKKKGISDITILERGAVGKEASFAAGGMLAPYSETNKFDDFFHFCEESLHLYPNFSEKLFEETGVDIELDKAGTLLLAFNEQDISEINHRYEWQKKAGLAVEKLSATDVHKLEPFVSPDVLAGLFFPNDWQVENRKLVEALHKFCELNEIKVIENTEISKLLTENGKVIGAESKTDKFFADKVILATGAWTSLIQTEVVSLPKVKPIRGQMIEFRTAKRLFSKVIYSTSGYLIPRQNGRILIGATSEDAGFDRNLTEIGTEILRSVALEIAPSLMNLEISEKWLGFRPFAADGLPILGEIAENLFIATAHYRNGILLAPITAEILAERVVNKTNSRYFETFSHKRFQAKVVR
ncbi:MAG: glycine oxidase ThiO [Pyrinomonadaceae bacterium]|nr:glycine oxidase ThiO [Pyrinomonadaceae bacterium]